MSKVTTNISSAAKLEEALSSIKDPFRSRLIKAYLDLRAAHSTGTHDAAGLRAGVFAETLVRFLQHELTGTHTPFGKRLSNFADICRGFEKLGKAAGNESLRLIIPRALLFVYTLRNKRGIGHAGGEVDANLIDIATCVRTADWCISELIRLYHHLSLEEAQQILDAISIRQTATIWSVGGKRRVLDHTLGYKEQTLLILYGEDEETVLVEDLVEWIEHPRPRDFRSKVLSKLHETRHVEWDRDTNTVSISPKGIAQVEDNLVKR